MEIAKSYLTDKDGKVTGVMIDVETFRKIESVLLDQNLARAMAEVEDEEPVDLETAKRELAD
jgi:hypothetical protein